MVPKRVSDQQTTGFRKCGRGSTRSHEEKGKRLVELVEAWKDVVKTARDFSP